MDEGAAGECWERVYVGMETYRRMVLGGWIVKFANAMMVFVPDEDHEWEI